MVNKSKKLSRSKSKNSISNQNKNMSKKSNKVRQIYVTKKLSDEYIKSKEGEYFDTKDYDDVIKENCDCYYYDENNKKQILLKFRKNVLSKNLCGLGIDCLKEASKKTHDNRGASAGVIDLKKMPTYANKAEQLIGRNKFRVKAYRSRRTGKIVKNSLGNISQSNIIGYYDKRDRNLGAGAPPCRTTAFTSQQVDKWDNVKPLLAAIDKQFKKLIPKNHKIQYDRAHDTEYVIGDTAFSTVTINNNWRTALHQDAGDLKEGFGNLVILEEGKYDGGYLGFPQFKVAVDPRNGDFLAMDVHQWHCNTKIIPKSKDYTRLSIVAYLRDKMINCKGKKLE
jgi:hypothetical protein